MKARRSLQDLIRDAGINPVLNRQPCLPAPSQPAIIASEEDHTLARNLLVEQRRNNPDYRDPSKDLKRIFRSSKEKEKLQDPSLWEFSQDELDQALSAVIDKPATSPGLVQAFLNLGAKVNFVETTSEKKGKGAKKPNAASRRRSTVLQRAATVRRADSVGLLASSGADQTTLDEGLKAALAANDSSCILELLRHGADINKFPSALADAVRSNNQNLVRLLLRAPKAIRPDIISSCLPAAVQQRSEEILSLLIAYGADPNFNEASALKTAISQREYRLAVALVAGPIPLTPVSLQGLLDPVLKMPTAQELYQFMQLLFCCGMSPAHPHLEGLLVAASKRNDAPLAHLLIDFGVSTGLNEAECLRNAIANANWTLVDVILDTVPSPAHTSIALAVVPAETAKPERLHVISGLVLRGASGKPLERWLLRAVEDGDSSLMDLLLNAGAPIDAGGSAAIQAAVARKDMRSLQTLLNGHPSPESLARVFPLIRSGYTPSERLATVRLLLEYGARGPEVDQALVDAVADTSSSRDVALITELVRHGVNIDYDNGKAISLAVAQADVSIVRLLCGLKPSSRSVSAALPLAFDANGKRSITLPTVELLLAHGIEEGPAVQALQVAVKGGPENLDIIRRLIATDARLLGQAFQYAVALDSVQKKGPILKSLLSMGLPQEAIDQALAAETRKVVTNNNTVILQMLLEQGASINYHDGEALSVGVASGKSSLTRLLLSGKVTPSRPSITKAFRSLLHDGNSHQPAGSSRSRIEIAQELLSRGVHQLAIDSALRAIIESTEEDIMPMVDLLLHYRANVNNADGTCFVFAAKRKDLPLFNKLLGHGPDFATIVPSLIGSHVDEGILLRSLESCFSHGCSSDDIEINNLGPEKKPTLILALEQYPRCEPLAKLLLSHGCNPDITVPGRVDSATGEEILPALVWALAQPQKMISSAVILALINSGASATRSASASETTPIALAAGEGRADIVQALLDLGADASARDKWNRSALYYASSTKLVSVVQTLSPHALRNDGSLHEAARSLQLDVVTILIKHGHSPNFPCRLHQGRNALGELCLNANITNASQRTKARQIVRLFLDNGANAKFKARNEKSTIILALDNPYSSLEVAEALLETEVWEDINDEKHMFRDASGLWYSPLSYVEMIPSPARAPHKQQLLDLLRDKGCEPKYYSESPEQPQHAVGIPPPIARLVDRRKEHELSLRLAKEADEHARMLAETSHRDLLRRKREQQEADAALAATAQAQQQALDQQKHDFEMQRVRSAERMKRGEKSAWHSLLLEQERDAAAARAQIEDRKASAAYVAEGRMIAQREGELEHRVGLERRALKEKEDLFDRNVKRQERLTQRLDESAQLHAKLRQERPAIEGAPQWGSVD